MCNLSVLIFSEMKKWRKFCTFCLENHPFSLIDGSPVALALALPPAVSRSVLGPSVSFFSLLGSSLASSIESFLSSFFSSFF